MGFDSLGEEVNDLLQCFAFKSRSFLDGTVAFEHTLNFKKEMFWRTELKAGIQKKFSGKAVFKNGRRKYVCVDDEFQFFRSALLCISSRRSF